LIRKIGVLLEKIRKNLILLWCYTNISTFKTFSTLVGGIILNSSNIIDFGKLGDNHEAIVYGVTIYVVVSIDFSITMVL